MAAAVISIRHVAAPGWGSRLRRLLPALEPGGDERRADDETQQSDPDCPADPRHQGVVARERGKRVEQDSDRQGDRDVPAGALASDALIDLLSLHVLFP